MPRKRRLLTSNHKSSLRSSFSPFLPSFLQPRQLDIMAFFHAHPTRFQDVLTVDAEGSINSRTFLEAIDGFIELLSESNQAFASFRR